jgi:hypothetical protein
MDPFLSAFLALPSAAATAAAVRPAAASIFLGIETSFEPPPRPRDRDDGCPFKHSRW